MRKVELRMNELVKYEVIKKLVESNGNKKRAALKLNCSIRTINRLIIKYKTYGKKGFVHGNRNRLPSTAVPLDLKNEIISLYIDEYMDTNFTHFCEIVKEDLGVSISDTTLNKWLRDEYILSPKARRNTKKNMKKLLKSKHDSTKSIKVKNQIKEAMATVDDSSAHPRRPRCKYLGEMIQMDASSFEWVNGQIWHLHVAVDDATGKVVGAYFDTQETLKGYYHVFYQILNSYGIPAMFYTDKRTVFEYRRKNSPFDDEDTFTQFSYACKCFGVDIKTTSVPQAKGRVERLNQTLQSRLPVELRRAHITDIEEANEFLNSYLKKFNEQFSLQLNDTKSVFEVQPSLETIHQTLAIYSQRKIDSGHCIKYKNKYYIPHSSLGIPYYFKKRTDCMVIEAFDGNLYVNVLDELYAMIEVERHEEYSDNFDERPKRKENKKKYIPPLNHPWRNDNILHYFGSQKHRQQIGANT